MLLLRLLERLQYYLASLSRFKFHICLVIFAVLSSSYSVLKYNKIRNLTNIEEVTLSGVKNDGSLVFRYGNFNLIVNPYNTAMPYKGKDKCVKEVFKKYRHFMMNLSSRINDKAFVLRDIKKDKGKKLRATIMFWHDGKEKSLLDELVSNRLILRKENQDWCVLL